MEDLKRNIAKNIAFMRTSEHMTQAELAEKIGYDRTLILRWEQGTREPFASQVRAIANVLNVDVAKLYE